MLIFKGSRQIWEAGNDEVYKTICNGQFGCYDGNFVNLKQDVITIGGKRNDISS